MATVRDILERKGGRVVSIEHNRTVLEAAQLMNEHRIGAVVITLGEKVIGIFTERDILNRVVAAQLDPAKTNIRNVMTVPVACCGLDTTRDECRAVMRTKRIRHLPVVESDRLVGIVSIGDLLFDQEAEQEQTIRYLYEYMYGNWP